MKVQGSRIWFHGFHQGSPRAEARHHRRLPFFRALRAQRSTSRPQRLSNRAGTCAHLRISCTRLVSRPPWPPPTDPGADRLVCAVVPRSETLLGERRSLLRPKACWRMPPELGMRPSLSTMGRPQVSHKLVQSQ